MFRRTPAGIANEHLFYNVALMVYCEGACSEDPGRTDSTCDELFWSVILRQFDLSFAIKSVGGKEHTMALFEDIRDNNLKNVLLCLDADYDRYFSTAVDHPSVIYSYGYSWETDAVLFMDFFRSLNLFINCANDNEYVIRFSDFAEEMATKLRRLCYIDILHKRSTKALFDRSKPQSIIFNDYSKRPSINIKKILQASKADSFVETIHVDYHTINGWREFFGKTVAKIAYHWFAFATNKEKSYRKVNYDLFAGHLASSVMIESGELHSYYRENVNKFLAYSGT